MAGDYRVGGMEDYRRIELNPAVNTVGLASVVVADSDLSDKARADQLREEFRRDSAVATASTPRSAPTRCRARC